MNISFHLPGEFPDTTAQQKKIVRPPGGRPMLVDSANLKLARRILMGKLLPHKPVAPLEGAVELSLTFVWPWRKFHKAPLRSLWVLMPKDTRPDADNMAKMLIDCMTRLGFWIDDAQVTSLHVHKMHGNSPFIQVDIGTAEGVSKAEALIKGRDGS